MKSLFSLYLILCIQINNFGQSIERSPIPEASPIICQIITDGCWNDSTLDGQYRIILSCEGLDHIYNRIFFQKLFLTPGSFQWKVTPAVEIELNSEEEELIISDLSIKCVEEKTILEFIAHDFWNENNPQCYTFLLNGNEYSLIDYNLLNK